MVASPTPQRNPISDAEKRFVWQPGDLEIVKRADKKTDGKLKDKVRKTLGSNEKSK